MNDFVFDPQRFANGTYSNDTLSITSSNSYVYAYSGNDSIYNGGYQYVTIDAGIGNDTVLNYANNNKILGGVGDDSLHNDGSYVTIDSGIDNDIILNHNSTKVSINADIGNDSINNWGSYSTINAGTGSDTIYNSSVATGAIIDTGTNNDFVLNLGDNTKINGNTGSDSVRNWGNNVTVDGGTGNDTIVNNALSNSTDWGKNVSLAGGTGNDLISLSGGASGITVNAGKGNDSIYGDSVNNYGVLYQFIADDGNDTLYNYKATDTISIGGSSYYTTVKSNNNILVSLYGSGGSMNLIGASSKTLNIKGGVFAGNGMSLKNYNANSIIGGTDKTDSIWNYANKVSINAYAGDDHLDNRGNNVTVLGGKGNDLLWNDPLNGGSDNVKLDGGEGNDRIHSWGNNSTLIGGTGNDTIQNMSKGYVNGELRFDGVGQKVTIDAGAGKDSIENSGSYVSISAGADGDYIKVHGGAKNVTVNAGTGNDTIYGDSLNGGILYQYAKGDGSDIFYNFGAKDSITITGADWSTVLSGSNVLLNVNGSGTLTLVGAKGKTLNIYPLAVNINNTLSNTVVNGTADNDTISNSGKNVKIYAYSGNDTIYNNATNVTISAGEGKDTINIGYADSASVDAGIGNDSILGNNNRTTITANDGDDTITGNHYGSKLFGGNGKDLISLTSYWHNTIDGGDDNDTIISGGGQHSVNGGAGNDRISLRGDNSTIFGGIGDDSIYNYGNQISLNGGTGNDTLIGDYSNATIFGDAGADFISITTYWRNTLLGGAGNDTIYAGGVQHSVDGGAGDDKISLSGDNLTIKGGTGNDTIYGNTLKSHLYQYAKNDGNDYIYNWSANDTLQITNGSYSTAKSGNDISVKVDAGTILLKNAQGKKVTIVGNKTINPTADDSSTQLKVIKKFMNSLDTTTQAGRAALNEAVNVATSGHFYSIDLITKQMVSDLRNSKSGNDFLLNYCGIDLSDDNNDTGAITGKDAGGKNILTPTGVIPEVGNMDTSFNKTVIETDKGVTFRLIKSNLSYDENHIWQAIKTWWADESLSLIKNSYDYSFSDSDVTNRDITINFIEDYSNTGPLAYTANSPRYINGVYSRELAINKVYYNSFAADDFDCKSPNGQGYLDRTFTHELTHAIMMSKINYFNDLPSFIKEGTAELTHGIDDFRTYSINTLANNPNLLEKCFDINDPCLDYDYEYASGYMFLRYLGKQGEKYLSSANSSNIAASGVSKSVATASQVTVKSTLLTVSKNFFGESIDLKDYSSKIKNVDASKVSKGIMIIGNKNDNSIVSGAGADTISGNVGKDTIAGGAGHDILNGDAGNDSINGSTGNDTINGGSGSNTLTGGKGKDIFVHTADKNFITDYTVGEDKIKIIEGEITSSSLSGSNVILNLENNGSITVKNGKGKKITVINSNGKETTKVYKTSAVVSDTTFTVTNSTKSPVTVGSAIEVIDASKRTSAVKITGNAKDNTIGGGSAKDTIDGGNGNDYILGNAGNDSIVGKNGNDMLFGNDGNDTLWGGANNDSLYGGEGADVFIYNSGKDVIADYASGDKVSLGAAISKSTISGSDVILTIGKGSLTLKNARGKTLSLINSKSKSSSTIVGGKTLTVTNSTKSPVTAGEFVTIVNASKRTSAVNITGNDLDNTINGGSKNDIIRGGLGKDSLVGNVGNDKIYGGEGNDTLTGGKGNDSLWGDNGADTFIYNANDGKDIIYGFANDDILKINGTFTTSRNASKKEVYFNVGLTSNAITLKNFSATTFNVNGTNYKLGSNKLIKK